MGRFIAVGVLVGILGLTGCTKVHYEGQPLTSLRGSPRIEQKAVVLYKPLSERESLKYFDRDWLAKGIQPIQIAIENVSLDPLQFHKEGLSLSILSDEMVKTLAHRYSKLKATTIGTPSAALLALGIVGVLAAPATFGLALALPIGVGTAGVHTASSILKAEAKLDQDYNAKFLRDAVIAPRGMLEGVIFVPRQDFHEPFTVKVTDTKTGKTLVVESKRYKTTSKKRMPTP
ncbi:MAG: hypothetical protein FJZ63_02210 [Chlamydiae bacterium]|nr:hypothetical protein [Chlamydiota bacterium]